jgi:tRNA A37 threonylcarbamoyladenosine dehydratase
MLEERLTRTIALLGKEKAEKVFQTSVMIIGNGAVGGYALEMIARLGFGKIFVVDFDCFEQSNLNRQILATMSTLGQKKCTVARERALSINPDAEVIAFDQKISLDNLDFILEAKPDFVIDAIDDMRAKTALIAFLQRHEIKSISAMGAARKTKPEMLVTTTLNKTEGCPMAKKLRDILRHQGVDIKRVACVFSKEVVPIAKDAAGNNVLGSLPMVPAVMGTLLATYVLEQTIQAV